MLRSFITIIFLSLSCGYAASEASSSIMDITSLRQAMEDKVARTAQSIHTNLRADNKDDDSGGNGRNLMIGQILDQFDICSIVEARLGEDFIPGDVDGACTCTGSLGTNVTLTCGFVDVCNESGQFCAEVVADFTLSGLFNKDGTFGDNPNFSVYACADVLFSFVGELCIGFEFAPPDFIVPDVCSFTYAGRDCICEIDASVPCYTFDCTDVVPWFLRRFAVADTCQEVTMGQGANLKMIIPDFHIPLNFVPPSQGEEPDMVEEEEEEEQQQDEEEAPATQIGIAIEIEPPLQEGDTFSSQITTTIDNEEAIETKSNEQAPLIDETTEEEEDYTIVETGEADVEGQENNEQQEQGKPTEEEEHEETFTIHLPVVVKVPIETGRASAEQQQQEQQTNDILKEIAIKPLTWGDDKEEEDQKNMDNNKAEQVTKVVRQQEDIPDTSSSSVQFVSWFSAFLIAMLVVMI